MGGAGGEAVENHVDILGEKCAQPEGTAATRERAPFLHTLFHRFMHRLDTGPTRRRPYEMGWAREHPGEPGGARGSGGDVYRDGPTAGRESARAHHLPSAGSAYGGTALPRHDATQGEPPPLDAAERETPWTGDLSRDRQPARKLGEGEAPTSRRSL